MPSLHPVPCCSINSGRLADCWYPLIFSPMHFVLLNQFYPPDVLPTGVVLEAVAEALVSRGHQVTVVCGQSVAGSSGLAVGSRREDAGYGQKAGDKSSIDSRHSSVNSEHGGHVEVVRLWAPGWGKRKSAVGKILSYAAYYGGVAAWLLRRRVRADVVVALTSPPYLSLLARAGAWWHGGHHAHWIMDLYPDVMVAHGMLNERSLGHGVLGALARWGMGGPRCREVITLGPDMAERLNPWLPANQPAAWVPLWGTAGDPPAPQEVTALRQQRGWSPETTVFLYSGNMGLGHRFTEVLEAMPQLAAAHPDQSIHLAYFGGGKRHSEIAAALSALVPSPSSSLPSGLRSQPSGFPHLPPPTVDRQPPTQAPLPSALPHSPQPSGLRLQISGLRAPRRWAGADGLAEEWDLIGCDPAEAYPGPRCAMDVGTASAAGRASGARSTA